MKGIKFIMFVATVLLLSFTACQKEELIDQTDNTNPDPIETTSNALVSQMASPSPTGDGMDLGCFSIDFTFELLVDGEANPVASEEDLIEVLESAELESSIDFVYPLYLTYPDGTTGTVNDGTRS